MASLFELTGKVAVITGAGRGIGRGIALELARCGAAVAVADRDLTLARAVAAEARALGSRAIAAEVDVGAQRSADECIAQVLESLSRLDILVNNAGVFQKQLGLDEDDADFNRCLDINLTGIWRMVRAVVPHLKAQRGGRIINIASVGGRRGVEFAPAYCASKAAVINLTQSLAAALGADNITVNTVCPGSIDTAMQEEIKALREAAGVRHTLESRPLAGPLTAEDIGYAVVFFASEAARNITGQALNVDCGSIMS
jgi:meso-butanediol dehydrogenase/(S,S)-butanediol dehydrogenase/diacetyl reductase